MKVQEQSTYRITGRYSNPVRNGCQYFSFQTGLGVGDEHPGDRLKSVIGALGITYEVFGSRVAAAEVPARGKPYARSNVREWVAWRSKPTTKAWLAIEAVTGRPMEWYLGTSLAKGVGVARSLGVKPDVETPARPKAGPSKKRRKG